MNDNDLKSIVDSKVALIREQLRSEYEQKFTQAMGQVQELEKQLREAKADLLYIERRAEAQRDDAIRGRGELHTNSANAMANRLANDDALTKEDFARVLPAKLEMTSLEDLLKAQAAAAGINPRDTEAFSVFHGIDERSINSYMAKRARGEK